MVVVKQLALRIIFGLEIVLFLGFYFFGSQGIISLMKLRKVHDQVLVEIKTTIYAIHQLQETMKKTKQHAFYLEKVAREQLHMASLDDEIYRMDNNKKGTI